MKRFSVFPLLLLLPLVAFAQLVPLELDQTITLPSAIAVWDVMPHPDGYYLWVQAVQPDTAPTTRIYWGRTDSAGVDSLDLDVGSPQSVVCFWQGDYEPCVVLAGRFAVDILDSTVFQAFQLSNAQPISPAWSWQSRTSFQVLHYDTVRDYRLDAAIPIPPPPQVSARVAAVIGCSYDWWQTWGYFDGEGHTRNEFALNNVLEADSSQRVGWTGDLASWTLQDTTVFLSTSWDDRRIFSNSGESWGHGADLRKLPTPYNSLVAYLSLQCYSFDPLDCESRPSICTFDSAEGTCILYTNFSGMSVAIDSAHYFVRWNVPASYETWMSVNVVSNNTAEEFLCYDSTRHVFDVLGAADGHDYGVTDTITLGSEPRIIGRYDSTSRRLAFRNGNQLKLYRFGEYLSTDDGRRPTLGVDYKLSAFPNPFNPSTQIAFMLPKAGKVQLAVYDITGREVRTLADEMYAAGEHRVEFDGAGLPSGIYFARLTASNAMRTTKLLLLK